MGTEAPRRIQRIKSQYWRTPANTVCVHRVNAADAGAWGSPFAPVLRVREQRALKRAKCARAVAAFAEWLQTTDDGRAMVERARRELRGKDLACFCEMDLACHADEL